MKLQSPSVHPGRSPQMHALLVPLLKESMLYYSYPMVAKMVADQTHPPELVKRATEHFAKHYEQVRGITWEDFTVALTKARPDCLQLFSSPQGRRWVERLAAKVTLEVIFEMLGALSR